MFLHQSTGCERSEQTMITLSEQLLEKFKKWLSPSECALLNKATQSVYSKRVTIDENELGKPLHDKIKKLIDAEFLELAKISRENLESENQEDKKENN